MLTNLQSIARHFGLRAEPNRSGKGGFVGYYAIPGKDEQVARDDKGAIFVAETEDEAIAAAGEDLCQAMNERSKFSYKHGYVRMTGAELSVAMKEIDVSPSQLAAHLGTRQERVIGWMDGGQDIPHTVHLLITLLQVPGTLQMVQEFTDKTMVPKDRKDT